jgi:signal transduction histidine kinase
VDHLRKVRPRLLIGLTILGSSAVTAALIADPRLHLTRRAPSLRVALETASTLIVLLVALLLTGRARRTRRRDELIFSIGLVWLAAANLLLAIVGARGGLQLRRISFAAAAVGAVIIADAAVAPEARLPARRGLRRWLPVAALLATSAVVAVLMLRGSTLTAPDTVGPQPSHEPAVLSVQVISLLAFAAAAAGFVRRAEYAADSFLAWVAVAMILAFFSYLNYFLFPPVGIQSVYVGDGFRLLSYAVLLGGAVLEVTRHWQRLAVNAVLDERRRLACEIHDSIAQEFAFIQRRTARGNGVMAEISAAAERGLAESRRAISALTRPGDEPFEARLRRELETVAARERAHLVLDLGTPLPVEPGRADALIAIASEAVSNAARHGHAEQIRVELLDRGARLRVSDDGGGFDDGDRAAAASNGAGFGLSSMRERALVNGGELRITSERRRGTQVEVVLE